MLEVKCNGRIYRLPEDAEILDYLDMHALEVDDDPHDTGILSGRSSMHTVHTRDTAALILERVEALLENKNITVPCTGLDGAAVPGGDRLRGTEYSELLDGIEDDVIDILEDALNGAKIVRHVLSGSE